jgi:hypothetical protein
MVLGFPENPAKLFKASPTLPTKTGFNNFHS